MLQDRPKCPALYLITLDYMASFMKIVVYWGRSRFCPERRPELNVRFGSRQRASAPGWKMSLPKHKVHRVGEKKL